jgi:RimJ/RimL family protein N-acetyltransferase
VPAVVAYRSLPDVCRYVPFDPMDADTVRARVLGQWSHTQIETEGDALILGVELRPTGELVGDMMLAWRSEAHRGGELGYVVNPAHRGHGYATEASHRLLHVAFDELGWHRVEARVIAENTESVLLAERLGMRREAQFVEHEWFKGRWIDELMFGLLDREWQAMHGSTSNGVEGCPVA